MSAACPHLVPTPHCVGTDIDFTGEALNFGEQATLELTIVRAIDAVKGSLKLGQDLTFGIASAELEHLYVSYPEEIQLLSSRACNSKQANWISGREAARLALSKLGAKPLPILRGDAGEPIWPDRIVGSISHCSPWSIAVAARRETRSLTIGIDLESSDRMCKADPHSLLSLICHGTELDWVHEGDLSTRLTMIFSAKESLYKSLYPLCKRYIDFNEVEISWCQELQCFRWKLLTSFDSNLLPVKSCAISCQQYRHLFFTCSVIELDE